VTILIVVANAVAALSVAAYLTITEETGEDTWTETIALNGAFLAVALVVFTIASIVRGKRLFAPSWHWLDDGTSPTPEQRRLLFKQPMRMAVFPLRYWLLAAVIAPLVRVYVGSSAGQIVVSAVSLVFGAMVAAGLAFLLGERALRPVFAEALAGGSPPTATRALGNGSRLVLAWALGSGVPLLGIVVTPFVLPDADIDPQWAMVLLAVFGLVSGLTTMAIAARSITQPLARVRAALQQVGAGDLGTAVVVDDPGELGQLQAGVNEMVAGLRQRDELEDLFGRHVGPAVVQQALERGPHLGGETRCVSALFVDLARSTELARRRPPHDVVQLLNRFFAAVVEASDAEGGWLDGYEGDGALCVFGAPTDQPDHATRALRAARRLAHSLAELRASNPDIDAGIGVATGDVVAGHDGTETRLEYTVIGPPVNTAARLTVAAKLRPCRVLVDSNSVDAADPEEQRCWRPGESVDLKGLDAGLAVFEPV
jgi:adenylate cyclase